ncbi:MAG: ribonuclease Y [Nitrospinae bacterium]|nr:ribonuclease Y [Nitrospinota bacterium]
MTDISYVTIISGIVILIVGLFIGYLLRKFITEGKVEAAKDLAKRIIEEAEKEVENRKKEVLLEAKEEIYKAKADFGKETREQKQELQNMEKRLQEKEEKVERKLNIFEKRENEIRIRERAIADADERIKKIEFRYNSLIADELRRLEEIAGITSEEAKNELKEKLLNEARSDVAHKIRRIEEEAKKAANIKAGEIISTAIQRCASDYVAETTVSVVDLPNDDMKGRIIGREGRNIRAFETATGIDLIVDDTPEAVILSGYDPIRREIARIALERLVVDGRIHPGRIEDVVGKATKEISTKIREEGEQALFELGIDGFHPEEVKLIGRLRYRTSYSQNVLHHSKEVAYITGIMAAELGADEKLARRAGLLHDIGKAVDHQTEGTHTRIGVDLAKRYNESKLIINAIAAHHEDVEPESIIAVLVAAADALSASRPGARREMLESYVKRLERLEEIGDSFKGVNKTYAIQAGREIRVIVEPKNVSDSEATFLAQDIVKKIENELSYPGEIKVTVIRETKAVEYAR